MQKNTWVCPYDQIHDPVRVRQTCSRRCKGRSHSTWYSSTSFPSAGGHKYCKPHDDAWSLLGGGGGAQWEYYTIYYNILYIALRKKRYEQKAGYQRPRPTQRSKNIIYMLDTGRYKPATVYSDVSSTDVLTKLCHLCVVGKMAGAHNSTLHAKNCIILPSCQRCQISNLGRGGEKRDESGDVPL